MKFASTGKMKSMIFNTNVHATRREPVIKKPNNRESYNVAKSI